VIIKVLLKVKFKIKLVLMYIILIAVGRVHCFITHTAYLESAVIAYCKFSLKEILRSKCYRSSPFQELLRKMFAEYHSSHLPTAAFYRDLLAL